MMPLLSLRFKYINIQNCTQKSGAFTFAQVLVSIDEHVQCSAENAPVRSIDYMKFTTSATVIPAIGYDINNISLSAFVTQQASKKSMQHDELCNAAIARSVALPTHCAYFPELSPLTNVLFLTGIP